MEKSYFIIKLNSSIFWIFEEFWGIFKEFLTIFIKLIQNNSFKSFLKIQKKYS